MSVLPIIPRSSASWTTSALRRALRLLRYHIERLQGRNLRTLERCLRAPKEGWYRHRLTRAAGRPLSLLYECSGRSCPNNRQHHPYRRAACATALQQILPHRMQQQVTCIIYGAGGLLHEAQLMEQMITALRPQRVHLHFIDEQYDRYFDEHILRYEGAHILQGSCPCILPPYRGTPSRITSLWSSRLELYMQWCQALHPTIEWQWSLRAFPHQFPALEEGYTLHCALDTELAYELPTHASYIILSCSGSLRVSPLAQKHASIQL